LKTGGGTTKGGKLANKEERGDVIPTPEKTRGNIHVEPKGKGKKSLVLPNARKVGKKKKG